MEKIEREIGNEPEEEFEEELEEEFEEFPEETGIRSFIRPGDGLIASFLVPVLVMLIIFLQRGIFPFGEESFLRTDMYHQYAPFFSEFQYKLTHGGSLLYSWDVGMGVNFAALYAYYLASPLNWLLVLCPKNLIIEFMTYSIVLKTGLAGLSMAWYLRRHCNTRDFGAAFFGIFYALSGYMAAYSWNIMWLRLHRAVPNRNAGAGAPGKRAERSFVLYCPGNVHPFQLLYLHYGLYFYGYLFWGSSQFWKGGMDGNACLQQSGSLPFIRCLQEVWQRQCCFRRFLPFRRRLPETLTFQRP